VHSRNSGHILHSGTGRTPVAEHRAARFPAMSRLRAETGSGQMRATPQ
jgi:hypothetical protein